MRYIGRSASGVERRTISQNATPATNAPPVRKQAVTVCGKVDQRTLLVSTAQKSVSSARPVSGLNS